MIKRCAAFLSAFTVVFGAAFYCNTYAATSGTTKFSVDVDDTVLELTIPANPAVIDLNPTMTGASFGSTSINVKVATNNITGYQLTMTPTNSQTNTSLIRTETIGTEQTYREIETLDLTDPVSTGYPEADFTANKWGYRILTNGNYYGIDPNNTTVSSNAWTTDAPTNGTNHNLTLAAKVDANTVSGAYETTLNFRAVTNVVVAKDIVTFNGNGADNSTAMDGTSITVNSGETGTLPTSQYVKSGYALLGWNTRSDGKGLSYTDGGVYEAVSTEYNQNITLYAQWVNANSEMYQMLHPSGSTPSSGVTISLAYEIAYTAAGKGMWERDEGDRDNDGDTTEYYQVADGHYNNYDVRWDMQGMTSEICNSVTAMHDDYEALDIRDYKLYHITKLKDGNCWMTQNLDYDIMGPLNSNTSDITDTSLSGIYSSGYSTVDGVTYWAPTFLTSNGWVEKSQYNTSKPQSFDPGNWYQTDTYFGSNEGQCEYTSISEGCDYYKDTPSQINGTHGHVGNYYNWMAAIASNSTFNEDTLQDISLSPKNSICPKNWRLPLLGSTATNINESMRVIRLYDTRGSVGDDSVISGSPLYFVKSGNIWSNGDETSIVFGGRTYYWTRACSRAWNQNFAYALEGYYATFTSSDPKNTGGSIRCIAR